MSRRKNNRKAKNVILSLMLVVAIGVTAAFAFLTASETSENRFTVGSVDVELTEPKWDENNPDGILENILPGQIISKDPTITNVGKNDAYVYMLVEVPKAASVIVTGDDGTTSLEKNYPLFSFEANEGWTLVASQVGTDSDAYDYYVYAYDEALVPDDPDVDNELSSATLFDKIVFANVTSEYADQLSKNGGDLTVSVTGYAIQSELDDNITGPVDAWRLYANQHSWGFPQNDYPLSFSNFRLVLDGGAIKVDNSDELNDENSSMYAVFSSGSELLLTDEEYDIAYQEFDKYEDKTYTLDVTYNSTELGTINDTVTASSSNAAWYNFVADGSEFGVWISEYTGDAESIRFPTEWNDMPVFGLMNHDVNGKMTAIAGLENVKEVYIPSVYETDDNMHNPYAVQDSAFKDCTNLETVIFDNTKDVTAIGTYVFSGCTSLNYVELPNISVIGDNTFSGCTSLKTMVIPNSVTKIDTYAFKESGLVNVVIPNKVTTIKDQAFYGCNSLQSVTLPENLTSLGSGVFAECRELQGTVVIPNSITEIPDNTFAFCVKLEKVVMGENVTSIGSGAFSNCVNISEITIPSGVTSIGSSAFSGCQSLTSINIPVATTSIGSNAFLAQNKITNVYYEGNSVEDWYAINFGNAKSNPLYASTGNLYVNNELVTSVVVPEGEILKPAFAGCTSITSITLPDGLITISESALEGCKNLTEIIIPDTVTTINKTAFKNCDNIINIDIPASVTTIKGSVFYSCDNLTEIVIPNTVTSLDTSSIFYGCSKLNNVILPNTITEVKTNAFYSCKGLASVTIPNTVAKIGSSAFKGCSSLADVYYSGTESEWSAITISTNNTELTKATVHYNS